MDHLRFQICAVQSYLKLPNLEITVQCCVFKRIQLQTHVYLTSELFDRAVKRIHCMNHERASAHLLHLQV